MSSLSGWQIPISILRGQDQMGVDLIALLPGRMSLECFRLDVQRQPFMGQGDKSTIRGRAIAKASNVEWLHIKADGSRGRPVAANQGRRWGDPGSAIGFLHWFPPKKWPKYREGHSPIRTRQEAYPLKENMAIAWKIAPDRQAKYWEMCHQRKCIAINWLNQTNLQGMSEAAILSALEKAKEGSTESARPTGSAKSILAFVNEIHVSDLVIANQGRNRVVGIGVVKSNYLPPNDPENPNRGEKNNRQARLVDWLIKDAVDLEQNFFLISTVTPLSSEQCGAIKQAYLNKYPKLMDTLDQLFPLKAEPQIKEGAENTVQALLKQFGQVILYGPPGTGKTRLAKQVASALLYQDLLERGAVCQKCGEPIPFKDRGGQAVKCPKSSCGMLHQVPIFVGPDPDDAKVAAALASLQSWGHFDLVVFHPAYEYEQFVGGIVPRLPRPVIFNLLCQNEKCKNQFSVPSSGTNPQVVECPKCRQRGQITRPASPTPGLQFEAKPGIFYKLCQWAIKNKRPAVLIIDEINRGNLPKLLGELVYALEYRDTAVTLPFEYEGNSTLTIPRDLYIIATMNSSDRSIGHIDVAIRRRFGLYFVGPDSGVVQGSWKARDETYGLQLAKLMEKLNGALNPGKDWSAVVELGVGHSYFLPATDMTGEAAKEQVRRKWKYQVQPLLREYDQLLNLGTDSLQEYLNKPLDQCLGQL